VVYQDAPCQDGRGAVLDVHANGPTAAQRSASGGNAPAAAEGAYDDKWHRAFAIRQFELPPLQRQLDNEVRQCDEQQRALAARKLRANNNLAGAVWEQSIISNEAQPQPATPVSANCAPASTRCSASSRRCAKTT